MGLMGGRERGREEERIRTYLATIERHLGQFGKTLVLNHDFDLVVASGHCDEAVPNRLASLKVVAVIVVDEVDAA